MPEEKLPTKGQLQARLRQVEANLFRAEYSGEINPDNPDQREILDFHIGTSAADVTTWVEEMAKGLGYSDVAWQRETE
jgi:hypothetical protein